jgi:integrase
MAFKGDSEKTTVRKAANKSGLLTDLGVRNLKPEGKIYWEREKTGDPATKGFCLRVTPKGTKTFYLSYTFAEKRCYYKLGVFDRVSVAEARDRCKDARKLLERDIDPSAEREAEKKAQIAERERIETEKKAVTVNEVLDYYLTTIHVNTAKDAERLFTNTHCDVRKKIGKRKLADITDDQLEDLFDVHINRGMRRNAGKLYSYMRAAFKKAKKNRPFKLKAWRNPFADIDRPEDTQSHAGDRWLDEDELNVFWTELGSYDGLAEGIKNVLRLMILTGQRLEQISRMRWSHIDLDDGVWDVPPAETKTGKKSGVGHVVPLAPMVVELLQSMGGTEGEDMVFTGRNAGKPFDLRTFSNGLRKMLQSINAIKPFTPRDLRRTVKTHWSRVGILKEIRNRIQGHAFQGVDEKHYDRYDYMAEKRAALEKWERELRRIVGDEGQNDNVVPLRA